MFTRLIKEITVSSRLGGPDASANPRLRLAVDKARDQNMPKDTIDNAIKRGAGQLDGVAYEEIRYEGYGINGAAVIVDCMTDNRTRTAADVRHAFSKYGGNLGTDGSVAFLFKHCGQILFAPGTSEDKVMEAAIDAGAEDVDTDDDETIEIYTSPGDLESVRKALEGAGVSVDSAESAMIAKQTVELDSSKARQALRLVELLEDLDDVQRVTANFDIPEDVFAEVAG